MSAQMNNYVSLYGERNPKRNIEDCEFVEHEQLGTERKYKRGVAWGTPGGLTLSEWALKKSTAKRAKGNFRVTQEISEK